MTLEPIKQILTASAAAIFCLALTATGGSQVGDKKFTVAYIVPSLDISCRR